MSDELRRGPLLAQPPVDDHPDAVGQRGGIAEVVGDEQRRQRQGAEHVLQLAADDRARVRVERRRAARRAAGPAARAPARARARRAGARRPRAARALAGELRDARGAPAARRRARRRRRRRPRSRARSCAGRARTPGRRSRPSAARAAGRPSRRASNHARAAERDPPAIGAAQPGDRAQDRRLAGARRPDQRDHLGADAQAEPSSNERRATAKSSSSVATRRGSCTRAARPR